VRINRNRLDRALFFHERRVRGEQGVPVTVTDSAGKEVVRAVISMYVSPKRPD